MKKIPLLIVVVLAGCEIHSKGPPGGDCMTLAPWAHLAKTWQMSKFTIEWNDGGSHSFTGSDLNSLPLSTVLFSASGNTGTYTDRMTSGKFMLSFSSDTLVFTPSDTTIISTTYSASIGCENLSLTSEWVSVNPETTHPTPQQHQIKLLAEQWVNKTSVNFSALSKVRMVMDFK